MSLVGVAVGFAVDRRSELPRERPMVRARIATTKVLLLSRHQGGLA